MTEDVVSAMEGHCDLCKQVMVRAGDDAWHPHTVKRACPPEPSTTPYDGPGWKAFWEQGLAPGRPGVEHFREGPYTGSFEDSPYDGKTVREVIDDYVLVRGDLTEEHARTQLENLIHKWVRAGKEYGVKSLLSDLIENTDKIEGARIRVANTFDGDIWMHTRAQIIEWLDGYINDDQDMADVLGEQL